MEETTQYSRDLFLENLNKLNKCTNNDERVMIEYNLLSMSHDPKYLSDTFDIIANDPSEENKLACVLFLKTMIRNNFSNNVTNPDDRLAIVTQIVKVLAESHISIKIKSQLGNSLKTGLSKILTTKHKDDNSNTVLMDLIKGAFHNNPTKIQIVGLMIAIKSICGSQNNLV